MPTGASESSSTHGFGELSTSDDVLWVSSPDGLRFFIDSEAVTQAIYVYRPIFDDSGRIVDLEVVRVNNAARRVPLAAHIVEGVRVSAVFVDADMAYQAANAVWSGRTVSNYQIERRGFDAGFPIVVHYEVATLKVGEFIVQMSIDHTTVTQLESADARFRLMADASDSALVLLVRDSDLGKYVVAYLNPVARKQAPSIRYGAPLPEGSELFPPDVVEQIRTGAPIRLVVRHHVLARHSEFLVVVSPVGAEEVMLSWRELTTEESARDELRRSDRVLDAIGRGSFGTIAVFEPVYDDSGLASLSLMWSAFDHDRSANPIDPEKALPEGDVLRMARQMLAAGLPKQSGWVTVPAPYGERSLEFALVQAGDRFVLEFVERTEELATRTALAALNASADAQRNFMSRVSHEMRSPLNVIHGYSQLLTRLALGSEAHEFAASIGEGVQRMVQIVDDLLLLGQLEQGSLRFEVEAVTVSELHAEVASSLRSASWWQPELLDIVASSRFSAVVRTDVRRFATIVAMLLEVTLDTTPGDPIRVDTFVRGARAGLQLVAPRHSATVRELWMPFASSHAMPGGGLGLAVARSLMAALDVDLELRHGLTSADESSLTLTLEPLS